MTNEPELFGKDAEVGPRLRKLLAYLGYSSNRNYIDAASSERMQSIDHALSIGVTGAFCLPSSTGSGKTRLIPIVYVASAADRQEADRLHRDVWSQDLVPLLVVATRTGVEIRNAFEPRFNGRSVPWEVVEGGRPNQDLATVDARNLVAAVAWRDFTHRTARRIDEHLLRSVRALSAEIGRRNPTMHGIPGLTNAVIGRMLYLLVLIDRGIVTQSWVDGLTHEDGRPVSIVLHDDPTRRGTWSAADTWRILDRVDASLNGSVFPIEPDLRKLVGGETLEFVRTVLRYDAILEGNIQLGFDKVSYRSIRSETLSALYELFLALEDRGEKKNAGAFYTPPYLADYVLDETTAERPLDASSIVCDPACGSGIFLVGAYRRIVEASQASGCPEVLERLMRDCIFGVERNRQAAAVTRFSLYLTMLDYLPTLTLEDLATDSDPLFPRMSGNIVEQDFFSAELPARLAGSATHVIANPPWTAVAKGSAADAVLAAHPEWPASDKRLAELFVWSAKDRLARTGAVFAILLSTRSFVSATAEAFPKGVASLMRLRGIANLSHFRYRLFRNARNPATLFVAVAAPPDDGHVWISAPLLTSQPLGPSGRPWAIAIDRGDVSHVRPSDLTGTERGWFWHLILQPVDRRFAQLLTERAAEDVGGRHTLGSFLERHGMHVRNGDSVGRTGLDPTLTLGADPGQTNYYVKALGLDGDVSRYELQSSVVDDLQPPYREMFRGPVLLVGRALGRFDVIGQSVAFNSSLNAVFFRHRSKVPRDQRERVLRSLKDFLESDLASYLYALFGRAWIIDRRRFETIDLKALPFPFETVEEFVSMEPDALPARFCAAFGLDATFADYAAEYESFRKDYEDGGIPSDALNSPSEEIKVAYSRMLIDRLRTYLGDIDIQVMRQASGARSQITIDLNPTSSSNDCPPPSPLEAYAWSTSVSFDPASGRVLLAKPLTTAAWTVERAYADAERATAAILAT